MGLIDTLFGWIFGGNRNVIRETAEVFRENAENAANRDATFQNAVLSQYAREFGAHPKGGFDRLMDGVNRLPRPALALGTLGLFAAAMWDPIWFAARMQGLGLVPEPLWWLLGAVVSFYFGARHQAKTQEFQKTLAAHMTRAPEVIKNIQELSDLSKGHARAARTDEDAALTQEALDPNFNPALEEWRRLTPK